MQKQTMSFSQFGDFLNQEVQQGILDEDMVMDFLSARLFPKEIRDKRDQIRLALERVPGGIEVTKYPTSIKRELN